MEFTITLVEGGLWRKEWKPSENIGLQHFGVMIFQAGTLERGVGNDLTG